MSAASRKADYAAMFTWQSRKCFCQDWAIVLTGADYVPRCHHHYIESMGPWLPLIARADKETELARERQRVATTSRKRGATA